MISQFVMLESMFFAERLVTEKIHLEQHFSAKIIDIVAKLRRYDQILFGFIGERYDQLLVALKIVNTEVLRQYVSAMVLAFFCILGLISGDLIDYRRLRIFIEIFNRKFESLEAFVFSIDNVVLWN